MQPKVREALGAILDQVRPSMDRAALAVQYAFLFTLAPGDSMLVGTLAVRSVINSPVATLRGA